jgi:Uncharacterized conserved protein (DUF2304)
MSNVGVQSLLVGLGGLGLLVGVFLLARRGLLSLRYALGWMAVSLLLLGAAVILVLIGGISHSLPITPTGLLAGVGLAFLLVVCLQLSISLSGQQDAIRELSEANALLGERLKRFEDRIRPSEDDPRSALRGYAGSVTRDPEDAMTTTTVNMQRI